MIKHKFSNDGACMREGELSKNPYVYNNFRATAPYKNLNTLGLGRLKAYG